MNRLEIVVFGIIAVCTLVGYVTGFLRTIYSLFAGMLLLVFVTWAAPQVTVFLEEKTGFGQMIQDTCVDYIEEIASEKIREGAEAYQKELPSDSNGLQSLLPELWEGIAGYAADAAGDVLEESGIYEEIAGAVSHYIIEGIVFLLLMVVGGMLSRWIAYILDFAARFPALKGPDKMIGAVLGAVKGLFLVWIFFFILTMLGGGESQNPLLSSVEESRALHFLYQNNILLWVIMSFFP